MKDQQITPTQAQHTPTPWTYLKRKTLCHVESAMEASAAGLPVCSIPVARANDAAFIVTACNAYAANQRTIQALAEALARIEDEMRGLSSHLGDIVEGRAQRLTTRTLRDGALASANNAKSILGQLAKEGR